MKPYAFSSIVIASRCELHLQGLWQDQIYRILLMNKDMNCLSSMVSPTYFPINSVISFTGNNSLQLWSKSTISASTYCYSNFIISIILHCWFINSIKFASDILTECVRNMGQQWCHYTLDQWKNKVSFDIFNYICDYVSLLQLRDTAGDVNQIVIIT